MTKEVLNKLPQNILANIENYKKQYNGLHDRKDEYRGRNHGKRKTSNVCLYDYMTV